jgi:hypothetical protein
LQAGPSRLICAPKRGAKIGDSRWLRGIPCVAAVCPSHSLASYADGWALGEVNSNYRTSGEWAERKDGQKPIGYPKEHGIDQELVLNRLQPSTIFYYTPTQRLSRSAFAQPDGQDPAQPDFCAWYTSSGVYILYLDESKSDNSVFVLGGIALHESLLKRVSGDLDEIQRRYLPGYVELHTRKMLGPSGHFHKMPQRTREAMIGEVASLIVQLTKGDQGAAFAVAVDAGTKSDPLEFAYANVCSRFDIFLKRQNDSGNPTTGIVIVDEAPHQKVLEAAMRLYHEQGTPWRDSNRNLHHLAELPLFTDSRNTRLLQMADFVTHVTFRRYDRNQNTVFNMLLPAFDQHEGHLHGLSHWSREPRICKCSSCVSRRKRARMRLKRMQRREKLAYRR